MIDIVLVGLTGVACTDLLEHRIIGCSVSYMVHYAL